MGMPSTIPYNPGFVYVALDSAHPELLKIGKTTQDVQSRVRGGQTFCIDDAQVLASWRFVDCDAAEKAVHRLLDGVRVPVAAGRRKAKEFFRTDLATVQALAEGVQSSQAEALRKAQKLVSFMGDQSAPAPATPSPLAPLLDMRIGGGHTVRSAFSELAANAKAPARLHERLSQAGFSLLAGAGVLVFRRKSEAFARFCQAAQPDRVVPGFARMAGVTLGGEPLSAAELKRRFGSAYNVDGLLSAA